MSPERTVAGAATLDIRKNPDYGGFVVYTALGVVLATGLILWAARKGHVRVGSGKHWRSIPLVTALVLLVLVALTFGAAVLLAPIGVGLTIVALRRLPTWRDPVVLLGVLGNGLIALAFLATLAIVAYDAAM
jgi:hypothetical protein